MSSVYPHSFTTKIIQIAQHMPRNWLGQQLAQLLRRWVIRYATLPLHCQVEGINFECHLKDNNSEKKYVFMPWRFDLFEREYLKHHIPTDGVFLDIGANVGIYSLNVATMMASNGAIYAFEPNPAAYERLRKNFDLNADNLACQCRLLKFGISDEEKTLHLFLNASNLGGSSLVSASSEHVDIQCRPLLDVIQEEGITTIDGLKIDIEGAEDLALIPFFSTAAASVLPKILVIENSEQQWRSDLSSVIRDTGYTLVRRTRMNSIYRLNQEAASS